ncbi:MAG: hypothetical protein QXD61_10505 [Candidatus Caldarchaeum sp.]
MVWRTQYDCGHVDYGLPLVRGFHRLVAVTGPADIWQVGLPIIVYDLVFWLALLVVGSWWGGLSLGEKDNFHAGLCNCGCLWLRSWGLG